MSLKIEFSAQFKDAQVVQAAVKSLQKELVELGKTGANASSQLNKSMQAVSDSLTKINQLSKGAGGLKDLNTQLDSIVKMSSGIQGFARSFDSVGRAINANLGNASNLIMKQFKNNMASIQSDIDTQTKAFTRLNDRMEFLKSRYGEDSDIYRRAESIQASRAIGIAHAEQTKSQLERENFLLAPRKYLPGGSISGFASGLSNIAQFGYGASELAYSFGTMGIRSDIAQRNLRMQVGQEALQGDPTLAIISRLGIGLEFGGPSLAKTGAYGAEYFREGLKYIGSLAAGALGFKLGGPGGALAAGAFAATQMGGLRGMGEIEADAVKRQRGIDKEAFGKIIVPTYQSYMSSENAFYDLYKMIGDKRATSAVSALLSAGSGLSMAELAPALNAATYYGMNVTDVEDIDLMRSKRDYGISDYGQNQLGRIASRIGSKKAVKSLNDLILSSGVGTDINARKILTDAAMGSLQQTGGTDLLQAGAIYSNAANAIAGAGLFRSGIPGAGGVNVEGAQIAVQAGQSIQQQMGSAGSFANLLLDQKLMSLGVTDFGARYAILSELSANPGSEKAIRAIQNITGMDSAEIRKAISQTGGNIADIRAKVFGTGTAQAKAIENAGLSVGGAITYGAGEKGKAFFTGQQASLRMIGDQAKMPEIKPPFPAPDAKMVETSGEKFRGAEGKNEAEKLNAFIELDDATAKIKISIIQAIAQGLQDSGKQIQEEMRKNIIPQTQKFEGTQKK